MSGSALRGTDLRVGDGPLPMLAPTSVTVPAGAVRVVVGDPGHGHTALALALAGRLRLDAGTVTLDGDPDPRRLQRSVALVDVPGVTEPDGNVPLTTVVGEELAMAGRPAGRRAVRAWLGERGLDGLLGAQVDEVPARERTRVLAELAAQRPGVRYLVATLPERHGPGPDLWVPRARALTDRGLGVLITAAPTAAAHLDLAPGTVSRIGPPDPVADTAPTTRPTQEDSP